MPGISRSRNGLVCSGVTSPGPTPVPPVVTMTAGADSRAAPMAWPTSGPSGTTTGGDTAYLLVPAEVTALSAGDEVEAIVLDPPEGGPR